MTAPIGFGCMRATAASLAAALDAGATLLDTAASYGPEDDPHANERLLASQLARRTSSELASPDPSSSEPTPVTIVSKCGLVRVGARFVADGRASALRAQCEGSVAALGRPVDLYLLHAIDPKTPLETSVRALAALQRDGLVRAIGVSNVSLAQLDAACAVADIAAVEVALSPLDDVAIRGGLVARCREKGIQLLAHSPLGGPKRAARLLRDPVLVAIALRHAVDPAAIVVAWLRDLAPVIVPIPGTTSPEHAAALTAGAHLVLEPRDRAALDSRFPVGALLRTPAASRRPREDAEGDVHLVMGMQGAGKSTLARDFVARGYERLNRDEHGGTLRALVARLDTLLAAGHRRVVLDNTYASRAARNDVIETAWRHGVPARVTWIDVPLEVAQANVVRRMLEKHGRLLEPDELKAATKKDPAIVPPRALFDFRRELEPPSRDEGFREIDVVPYVHRPSPAHDRDAVLVALGAITAADGTLDLARLAKLRTRATVLAVFGWTPSPRPVPTDVSLLTCSHPGGPPLCWCRPPLPGLLVALMTAHRIDPAQCVVIGTTAHHVTMSRAVGATYEEG